MKTGRDHACRIIEAVCLAFAAVFAFVALLYGASWEFHWSGFYPWVLSPYVVFFALSRFVGRLSPLAAVAGCVAAVLILGFTLFAYIAMFISTSSTAPLLFIFLPLYLLIGGPVVFGIALGVGRFIRLNGHENT